MRASGATERSAREGGNEGGSRADRPLYGIDAGGSRTAVRTWDGERWEVPSVNPSSVGQDASDRVLAGLFGRIRAHASRPAPEPGPVPGGTSARPAIWLASASFDPATAEQETRRITAVARIAGLHAELMVSNDVTPLVLDAPIGSGHVVVVCGTGSAFLATDGRSAPVRAGGCEYLGSDEGSAFDLGLRGLRAAVRGLDGRGPPTALTGLLAAAAGAPVPELARRLAGQPFPKAAVAALAPLVLRAWLDEDAVAGGLVDDAIGELAAGIRAARDGAAIAGGWQLSVVGGVATGCPEFFDRLAAAASRLGADPVRLISDPAESVLAALGALAGQGRIAQGPIAQGPIALSDPRVDRDTWLLDLPG
ncbi:MAG TPA: BadF/BadG/BcrA/BcrD ATPase family protein [Streptosporangiaceae bacterium]|nr:BadF/BadG/BcrA/BcrD ATPase family protein [Streptosporangiaceae bacterium]